MEPPDISVSKGAPEVPASRRGLGRVGLAVVTVIVVIVGVATFIAPGGDDRAQPDDPAATPEAFVAPADDRGGSSGEDVVTGERVVPGAPVRPSSGAGFPPDAEHMRIDQIMHVFNGVLDTDTVRYGIAYLGDGELIVLDERGVSGTIVEVARGLPYLTNVGLLSSGQLTWAIDELDRTRSYLVSAVYEVVDLDGRGTLAVVRRGEVTTTLDILADGNLFSDFDLPATTEVLAVEDRGVLLMPRTGGTFELHPHSRQPVRISTDRAIAASRSLTIYESCDERLECRVRAEHADGRGRDLPSAIGAAFHPSPDGRWVIADLGDEVDVVSFDDGGVRRLAPGPVDAVSWADDGTFAAVLRGKVVEVHMLDEGTVEVLRLGERPERPSIVVFSSAVRRG